MILEKSILDGRTDITSEEVKHLSERIRSLYFEQPNVVEIPDERTIFVGDLHGDLGAVKTVFEIFRRERNQSIVFLGDYADRGPFQVETVNFVFALGLVYPDNVTILRGNHESERVANAYGFYNDVKRKHSEMIFRRYLEAFEALPIAGASKNGVFACHGGVPEKVTSLKTIQTANRHTRDFDDEIIMQMVWNDPVEADVTFRENIRGTSIRTYGRKAFDTFAENVGISLMIRAHEAFPEGYKTFFNGRLVSVFSTAYNERVKPKVLQLGKNLSYSILAI